MNEQRGSRDTKQDAVEMTVDALATDGDDPKVADPRTPHVMTSFGAASIGALIAGILGAVFWASYAVTAGVFCSGLPRADCPSSWVPYAVVSIIGFVVVTLLGAFAGWAFFRLYQLMRVD
jgi:hypothetical protein